MKTRTHSIFRLIIALASLVIVVGLSRSVYSMLKRDDIATQRQEVLRELEADNEKLLQKLEEVQGPAFIERTAREKLGMVREGEAIVIVPKTENSEQKTENQEDLPNWKKWLRLFF